MRARLFTLIMILAISLTISAQQKKVAVYITGEDSGVNKVLGDQLVAAFARSGKYVAVERTASFLAELGKEHNYQRSGAVSDNQIAALGVQFGVNYVCVADVSEVFGEKYISARLIDVETAEIVNTHNVSGEMNSMSKCLEMANEVADVLSRRTFAEQAKMDAKEAQLKAKGLVDLGLPSGALWKSVNESGLYDYYTAVKEFGNQLPTKEQWEELKNCCKWTWIGNGMKVVGINGNYIVLPAEGWVNCAGINRHTGMGKYGVYWSSTPFDSEKIWYLDFNSSGSIGVYHDLSPCVGRSVRLVKNP